MRLLHYYNMNNKKSLTKKIKLRSLSFEHILFISCVTVFFLLILVQTALVSPFVRAFLEVQNEYEGQPLDVEEFLYAEGLLELRLSGAKGNENVKVMVNGDLAAVFNTNTVKIRVRDGDVVEIDASEDMNENEIEVISQSDNIVNKCTGIKINVKSEVKQLVRVEVE